MQLFAKDAVNAKSLHDVQGQAHRSEIHCRLSKAQKPRLGEEVPELPITGNWESILAK